jgi:hypothetical protein
MKATSKKIHPKLEQLSQKVGGKIHEDGELYYGPVGREIYISTDDGSEFSLWSERPLYSCKDGRLRLTRVRTSGDSRGWYSVKAPAAEIESVLKHSLGHSDSEVAYENILQHCCVRDPSCIERGLTIYQKRRIRGVEFDVGGRFIDILAVDAKGSLVVIEFKRSRGHEQVLGQVSRYMGWIRKHIAKPDQQVRAIIIARHVTGDLRLAAAEHPNIQLKEYDVRIDIKEA